MAWRTCSRGHRYQKTGDRPICPKCWSGYYRTGMQNDLPATIGAPALRALLGAGLDTLTKVSKKTAADIAQLHGVGPKALRILTAALTAKKLTFRKSS